MNNYHEYKRIVNGKAVILFVICDGSPGYCKYGQSKKTVDKGTQMTYLGSVCIQYTVRSEEDL